MRRSRSKINFNKNMNGKGWPLNSKPNKHSFTQSCLEMQENIFFLNLIRGLCLKLKKIIVSSYNIHTKATFSKI